MVQNINGWLINYSLSTGRANQLAGSLAFEGRVILLPRRTNVDSEIQRAYESVVIEKENGAKIGEWLKL